MNPERYDYSGLNLKTLFSPRYRHLLLLLDWVYFLIMYRLTESLIPLERCVPMHCFVDDIIPFNEFFVVFYISWFVLIVVALVRPMLYDIESFKKVQIFIFLTQTIAFVFYILLPSRQDLRPEVFARSNVFTWIMGIIYAADTSTGVCPSLHVAYSLGILSVGLKDKTLGRSRKILLGVWVFLICISVCFVKQHSFVDVLAAVPMCLVIEIMLYGKKYWLPKIKGEKAK